MFQILCGCLVKSGNLSPRAVRDLVGHSARLCNHNQSPSDHLVSTCCPSLGPGGVRLGAPRGHDFPKLVGKPLNLTKPYL